MQSASASKHTYNDGRAYLPPRGQHAPRKSVEDRQSTIHPVINLRSNPTPQHFLRVVVRELRIRFYAQKTVATYRKALSQFLRWYRGPLDEISPEDVRQFLELMVEGGASSSWVSVHLSALRTAFDKLCGADATLGLATPRRPKRVPVVLSTNEIKQLLHAAPSLRDKLLIGLMYATGLRVSEVVRLRWSDIDFDRKQIRVWRGKGNKDRYVMLPASYQSLLEQLSRLTGTDGFLFPAEGVRRSNRHLSPRTAERVMERAVKIAGIKKKATPHSLRHSFACHLLEHGTDIRFIQTLLGHARLETTTIYTKVAQRSAEKVESPMDSLPEFQQPTPPPVQTVGTMRLELTRLAEPGRCAQVDLTIKGPSEVRLTGIVVREPRAGWVAMELPPLEHWMPELRQLPREQRERIESPEFYRNLHDQVTRRFLACF